LPEDHTVLLTLVPPLLDLLRVDLLAMLLLAALLGGGIGLERELSGKPAGFRTNLLICVGAALLTDLSIAIARAADPAVTQADPGRIAAQIVSGIGFLGAGTIMQARGSVTGLTTAATLWVVAAIGIAVGAGAYVEAIGTALLVIVALLLLGRLELALLGRHTSRTLQVTVSPEPRLLKAVEDALRASGFDAHLVQVERTRDALVAEFQSSGPRGRSAAMTSAVLEIPGVRKVVQG
jgi:putative Mg2+ transporter-C (MgtC) family protein